MDWAVEIVPVVETRLIDVRPYGNDKGATRSEIRVGLDYPVAERLVAGGISPTRAEREGFLRIVVEEHAKPPLLEVVGARRPSARLTCRLDCRQQQPDEYADDRDDDQQFDQGEPARWLHAATDGGAQW